MAEKPYELRLNFLAVEGGLPPFTVYRKRLDSPNEERPSDDVRRFTLPIGDNGEKRASYWVSYGPKDGYEAFSSSAEHNVHLARRVLLYALYEAADSQGKGSEGTLRIHERLELTMQHYPEGADVFTLEPYYFKAHQEFGFIADFHFRKDPDVPFSKTVQQRSLSLTKQFRRNANFHLDKTARIESYIKRCERLLGAVVLPGNEEPLSVTRAFSPTPAFQLSPRVFRFGGGREGLAQFAGVRDHGPFGPVESAPKLLFAFLQDDRPAAIRFANALSGQKKLGIYNGFRALFRTDLSVDRNAVVLQSFEDEEIDRVLTRAISEDPPPVTMFILPDKDEDRYLRIKSKFTNAGLPTQACTVPLLSSDEDLKWSIANLALQVFCKAGGQPWEVRGTSTKGLIIGISQSHKLKPGGGIDRFFAFSVLTDNNGVFRKIRVLADDENHSSYIESLNKALTRELAEAAEEFQRVVVHASFRLRGAEMAAIEGSVKAASEQAGSSRAFAVFKINEDTRFFGTNPTENSLVPYDASVVPLSYNEYLVWFQGIERERKTAAKAYPGPTHIQKLWGSADERTVDPDMLQDLVNLSGANWRGFNARSSPISVYYCHLVAEMIHDFQERGLPLPSVEDLRPWFL